MSGVPPRCTVLRRSSLASSCSTRFTTHSVSSAAQTQIPCQTQSPKPKRKKREECREKEKTTCILTENCSAFLTAMTKFILNNLIFRTDVDPPAHYHLGAKHLYFNSFPSTEHQSVPGCETESTGYVSVSIEVKLWPCSTVGHDWSSKSSRL